MRLIKRETTIPVPEVYAFDASLENELGCPFILMEHLHGKPLHDVWFAQGISLALREQIRIRALHGIAEAMAQLNTLTFSQGGSLLFDAKGDVVGMVPTNIVDLETQIANMRSTDYDNTMAFCQTGPFSDPGSYLLSLLDSREGKRERGIVEQGAYKLLRLFIEWSLMDTSGQEKPFVLAHPDLDSQNILVNDDGSLSGIIDWDWIAAVPHCVGPHSLPQFLMQDYNPAHYAYDVEAGEPKEGFLADSPAELASYRAMYAQFMEANLSKDDRVSMTKSRRHAARVRKSRKEAADMTRRSLITTTLQLAVRAPSEMKKLMVHVFDELDELTAADWPDERSTTASGERDDSDENGGEDMDTEASEVEDGEAVREDLYIHNDGHEEKELNVEHLSIDELVDEIEKLTGTSLASESNRDLERDPTDLEGTPPADEEITKRGIEVEGLGKMEPTKEAREPRTARICGWAKKKLRRGARYLHKKPEKNDHIANAALHTTSRPTRAARTICGWTEKKLRRVAHCLHCGDDEEKAKIDTKVEGVRSGALDVLKGLQTKLKQLRQKLHRKERDSSSTSEGGKEEAPEAPQVTSVFTGLTRAEKRSVCGKFAQMVQDNRMCLTADQQITMAHWVIQTLQKPDFSDTNVGCTRGRQDGNAERLEGNEYSGEGDLAKDPGYEEGHEDTDGSSDDGRDGNIDAEEIGHDDGGENKAEPRDQASKPQLAERALSRESDHLVTETAGLISNEEDAAEVSQAAVGPSADEPEQVDTGDFDLLGICIALANDDLDERRMQRLRDGFFGLLNQTL